MKNVILITTLLLFPVISYAQNIDLASSISSDEEIDNVDTEIENEEKNVNDKDTFSFLNFSFIKKNIDNNSENTEDASETKETPLEKIHRKAQEGKLDAQLSLGYMYLYGQDGVQVDYKKSFYYYELAARQNNAIALNNLGSLYFNGIGTEINYQKAAELFFKAAQNGSDDAAVNLAFIYLSSDDSEQHEAAINLFKEASKAGNNTAKFMLGYAHYKGFVVEQNFHKAIENIKEAAKYKLDIAQYMLGMMYRNGEGIAKNYGNAVKYLRMAANQGNVPAMMELGDIYAQGTIYPKNEYMAHVLFNIASVYDAPGADERRDEVETLLKIENLLQAQTTAEKFQETPSELTSYIRQTYGYDVRLYIDENLKKQKKVKIQNDQ